MSLSERKEKIIEAVVDNYINKYEPVSSTQIQERYLPSLSSATIRNELATLEEMGYLMQPHTSAGRIPTADAYRLYVEKLMPKHNLTATELKIVETYFSKKIIEIDDILRNTAKVISEITNLTSVAYLQNYDNAKIESIKIVKLTDDSALYVIVTDYGLLKETTTHISKGIDEVYFLDASRFVTDAYKGFTILEAIDPNKALRQIMLGYEIIFDTVFKILKNYSQSNSSNDIVLEGSSKILNQPEYSNIEKAKAMFELLDAKEELLPVLKNNDDLNVNIKITKDNEIKDGLPECAIVTAKYSVNGINIGSAGVIGPVRMDYSKVVSVLDYITKIVALKPTNNNENNLLTSDIQENK